MAAIRLGLMPPLTGLVGIYGAEISRAGQIACQEINEAGGVLGQPLELVIEDDGSLPDSAVAAANRLVHEHRCPAIIGNLLSNSRIAVAYQVAEPNRVPYLNFSFYEGSILSRYFFHFAALPNQQIDKMIPSMCRRFGRRMFFAGNNYEWPRGSIDAAKRALAAAGGEAVGEEYCPIGVPPAAIEALLDRVEAAAPDVFVPYFAGDDQIRLLTRFTARGMKARMAVVMGHFDELMASHLAPEVRAGFYSSNSYFMSVDTPENRRYLARLAALPGVAGLWPQGDGIVTNFGEGAYLCAKAFAQAANRAGSLDAEALVAALADIEIAGPQGVVRMNPTTHHASVNNYLTLCQPDGSFTVVEKFAAIAPVLPDRYRHLRISPKAALEEDVRLQARMLEQMSEAVLLVKTGGATIVFANAGAERMFGLGQAELIGSSLAALVTSDGAAGGVGDIFDGIIRHGRWEGEIAYRGGDDAGRWGSVSVSAFTHPVLGEVWMWVQKDISERKALERELEAHRQHLESLVAERTAKLERAVENMRLFVQHAPISIAMFDRDMNYLAYSGRWLTEYGRGHADLVGRSHYDVHPDLPDEWRCVHRRGLAGETIKNDRDLWHQADGSRHWLRWAVQPWTHPGGEIGGIIISAEDITQSILTQEALIEAKDAAEAASKAKSAFLANMSHEIRTPLHGMLGMAQLGRRDSRDETAQARFARILDSGRLLMRIIDDILDFSKIEAGRLEVDAQPMKLPRILDRVVELMAEHAEAKGLALRLEKAADLPAACIGDPQRLEQILLNLLANAVKFTERGGVTLSAGREGQSLVFRVADTGIGIGAGELARLFQPFHQAEGATTTRRYGGTGLGLAISRRLAGLMGGDIRAESRVGAGSVFELRLPLREVGEQPAADDEAALDGSDSGEPRLSGLTILAAEDNAVNQLVIEDALVPEGAELVVAGNGREAVELFRNRGARGFDAVLMDVGMPEMDGFEAARRILEMAPEVPIIGLTGFATAEDRQRCFAAGMADHIAKPFEFRTLINVLLRQCGRLAPAEPGADGAAAGGSGAAATLIDWAALSGRYGQRAEALPRLLQVALTTQGATADRLREAARQGRNDEMAAICHEVAGMAGMLEAHRLRSQAKAAEALARAGDGAAAERLHALAGDIEALLAEIRARLAS